MIPRSKILYLVAAEGNGHATRSAAVMERLKEAGHTIIGVSEANALKIIEPYCSRVIEAVTPHMEYRKNNVTAFGTILINLMNFPRWIKDLIAVKRFSNEFQPDLIITDFNPMARFIHGPPIISIDNQCVITHGDIEIPKGWGIECLKSRLVVRAFTRRTRVKLITTFFDVPILLGSVRIRPIVSKKVRGLKTSEGSHILVYQTSQSNVALADLLPKLGIEIKAYGFASVGMAGKTSFLPFDQDQWFKDLASCKAVIINGGFSLISESLTLKKPILSFPIGNQFEQALNAHYLHKEGLGVWGKEITREEIDKFIKVIPAIKSVISKKEWGDGAQQAADYVNKFLAEHADDIK
ncbi:MAG: glycosyltransferase family protein [Nanoarchaeota archaeon]